MVQISHDHGAHFLEPIVLAGPFDMRKVPVVGGHYVGDEVGLAASANTFVATFVLPAASGTTKVVSVRIP
jgi:hypothetical protein